MRLLRGVVSAVVLAAAVAGTARADGISISAGQYIKLSNGPGNDPGGEFIADLQTGSYPSLSNSGVSWNTFCLETNEYFDYYGQVLRVKAVTDYASAGGSGGAVGGQDHLDDRTAWLYTQMSQGTLVGKDGTGTYLDSGTRAANATALQKAIWYIEQEGAYGENNYYAQLAYDALAIHGGTWTGLGNIRVLNLEKWNGSSWVNAQDQLVDLAPVPEPLSLALVGAGLAGLRFARRRGKRA